MSSEYQIPLKRRLARPILRSAFRLTFHAISRVIITGKENVPRQGAYLIATNHISLFEAPLVGAFWPVPPEAMGASEIWDRPGQGQLVRWYGVIPVHRGQYDRQVLEKALLILRSGFPLVIMPEGGRSHTPGLREAHAGMAFLIEKAQVPVIPVGIVGSTDDFLQRALHGERPTIEMRIGQPLIFPPMDERGADRRKIRQEHTEQVMTEIAALLPPEYRGFYADHVRDRETHQ